MCLKCTVTVRYDLPVHRTVLFIAAVAVTAAGAAAPPPAVEIVLDASASMNRAGPDGSPIHARVRESLAAVLAEAAAPGTGVKIGLRTAGGGERIESLGSCSVTELVLPASDLESVRWIRSLDSVQPWGLRPLFASLLAAVDDMDLVTGERRIVVVTSGGDQCGLGPQQVAASLAARNRPVDLRIVGLGLGPETADRFGAVPLRNAATAEELLAALRWAILDLEDAVRPTGSLVLELQSGSADPVAARVEAVDLATGEETTRTITGEDRLDLAAGRYNLTIAPATGGPIELRDLLIRAGTESGIALEPGARPPTAVDLGPHPIVVGRPVFIDVAGEVPDGASVLFVDANGLAVSGRIDPFGNRGWTVTPPPAGPLDLLLVGPEEQGARRVLAARSVMATAAKPDITAPDEAEAGKEIVVDLSGPEVDTNFVGLAPHGAPPTEVVSCGKIGAASTARLVAPLEEGTLDLVYVDSATMTIIARHAVRIAAPGATISAPARSRPGESIEVDWTGPENDEDFLTLAREGSPDDAYLEWTRTEGGSPATFRAPDWPGAYEVRYVDGRTGKARARASIEVEAVPVELTVPATARCGRRIEVVWTGPGAPGDFLAIAKPNTAPQRFLDWSPTSVGSPLTLAAPPRPGTYEVRYVTDSGRTVLAAATLEIEP